MGNWHADFLCALHRVRFWMLSSGIVLIMQKVFPFWILAVILGNFLVFLMTSVLRKARGQNLSAPFFFDRLGRIVSASFYGLPFLLILLDYALPPGTALYIMNGAGILLTFGAMLSAYSRIKYLRKCLSEFSTKEAN